MQRTLGTHGIKITDPDEFENQCIIQGMWIQEEFNNPKLEAYLYNEYMGYYNLDTDEGFILLGPLVPVNNMWH